jgi:hypothetical protein
MWSERVQLMYSKRVINSNRVRTSHRCMRQLQSRLFLDKFQAVAKAIPQQIPLVPCQCLAPAHHAWLIEVCSVHALVHVESFPYKRKTLGQWQHAHMAMIMCFKRYEVNDLHKTIFSTTTTLSRAGHNLEPILIGPIYQDLASSGWMTASIVSSILRRLHHLGG